MPSTTTMTTRTLGDSDMAITALNATTIATIRFIIVSSTVNVSEPETQARNKASPACLLPGHLREIGGLSWTRRPAHPLGGIMTSREDRTRALLEVAAREHDVDTARLWTRLEPELAALDRRPRPRTWLAVAAAAAVTVGVVGATVWGSGWGDAPSPAPTPISCSMRWRLGWLMTGPICTPSSRP